MQERFGLIKFAGKDATVVGEDIIAGMTAPEFSATYQDWNQKSILAENKGKVRIIASMPSLDTSVCDLETRRFNQEAAKLGENIAIIVISTDLPFAQKRWCGAAGIDSVQVVSDHMAVEFGQNYGCLIKEARVLRRAVFVINQKDQVTYAAYMPALGVEPDYEEVLASARAALNE